MKHGDQVRERILNAGIAQWPNVGVRAIARDIGMSHGAVLYHFGTAAALKDAITKHVLQSKDAGAVFEMIQNQLDASASK